MPSRIDLTLIKRLLLLFWAAWLSAVVATNVLNALQALGWIDRSFPFVSGNWAWINAVMDPLHLPRPLQAFLFAGAIAWEALAALCYWRALANYRGRALDREPEALLAVLVNLALWAAFQLMDEVLLSYEPESVHRTIFLIQLASLVVLWLPADQSGRGDPGRLASQADPEAETLPEFEFRRSESGVGRRA